MGDCQSCSDLSLRVAELEDELKTEQRRCDRLAREAAKKVRAEAHIRAWKATCACYRKALIALFKGDPRS